MFELVSTGSYLARGGIFVSPHMAYQGQYQIQMLSNRAGGAPLPYRLSMVPGAFHRALFTCDGSGGRIW
jgi:hypothetical protein